MGKTSVVHTLAQEAYQRGELAASFFFARTDDKRDTIDNFISIVSYQLGLLSPRAKDIITRAIVDDPLCSTPTSPTRRNLTASCSTLCVISNHLGDSPERGCLWSLTASTNVYLLSRTAVMSLLVRLSAG